jgi:amino acid transporter
VQGPTAGVVIAPAVLASISGGGTALVLLVAAVVSAFVAALACAVGASRILFALGRDTGPGMLRRTSRLTGAPVGALIWVGAGSLLTLLLFIAEPVATRAVAVSLAYGADLIIAAYILVVIAAIIFTIRRRMAPVKTVILLIGLAVLGYILKDTFVPLPAAPFSWDALAAGVTLAAGIVLPLAYPPVRLGIRNSPCSKSVPAR